MIDPFIAQVSIDFLSIFESLGLPVAVLVVMIYVFIGERSESRVERSNHREERKEWRKSNEDLQGRSIKALEELTSAIKHDQFKK